MKKFNDYEYTRLDMDAIEVEFMSLIEKFNNADSFEEQDEIMNQINKIRNNCETMINLVEIRNSINTLDEYYDKELEYVNEIRPIYEGMNSEFYAALLGSKFRADHEVKWGKQIFRLAGLTLKTFKPEIIEDLQQENKLTTQYTKLKASATFIFEGKERNYEQMIPFTESKDRQTRIKAQKLVSEFFHKNESEFDRIYDELVKVRDRIAKKLGFKNFVEVGYARMLRSDYDAEMTASFRKQIYENIVPLASQLRERQADRLKLDALKYYDEPLEFLSGNATPKGEASWILENGKKMYKEMSAETEEFFNYILDRELLDVIAKKGKSDGGYCTFINNHKAPFIFSNFNGTAVDVDVLTHEAGHAFQTYLSKDYKLPEYVWATAEASEIHSLSMEYFAWPWMEMFFKDEVEKYKFAHLSGALLFIPYGVTVDEFQHWVYENPTVTPDARKAKWREIEKKYLPYRDYEDNDFLERGGYWFRQVHIFFDPFYYIDYILAYICSFEFWEKSRESREKAWSDYLKLCKAGGSKSFFELIELANLHNPFVDGTIKKIVNPIAKWLESIDDKNM